MLANKQRAKWRVSHAAFFCRSKAGTIAAAITSRDIVRASCFECFLISFSIRHVEWITKIRTCFVSRRLFVLYRTNYWWTLWVEALPWKVKTRQMSACVSCFLPPFVFFWKKIEFLKKWSPRLGGCELLWRGERERTHGVKGELQWILLYVRCI